MKTKLLSISLLFTVFGYGQDITLQLHTALQKLSIDSQFKHAIISLYVVASKTGKVIIDKNAQIGLAPASCQKVVTSVAAFELLGKTFRYKTDMGYDGIIKDSVLNGNLHFTCYGDPSLGSWRWPETGEVQIQQHIIDILKSKKISIIKGNIIIDESNWERQATPKGWVWEDVGNYYGAGARALNWHENQYDLLVHPGKNEGDLVEIVSTKPELQISVLINELKTGKEGSGDNSIIYLPEDGLIGAVRGTVPAGKKTFTIIGAMPNASVYFTYLLKKLFDQNNIQLNGSAKTNSSYFINKEKMPNSSELLFRIFSPPIDSLNYWFLKKSINLFGEAFVKTIAFEKTKFGSADTGIAIIKDFWSKRGIEKSALNIIDGSGLSPANRVTTTALVTVMQYARQQSWFSSFYYDLPQINGITMKDGYINGVRSYTGFIKNKKGDEYTFSFIINNFNGNPSEAREKMWKLLDILK